MSSLGQPPRRVSQLLRGSRRTFVANTGARVGALVALALSTVLVAWATGPAGVGVYTLARVLPGLVGVVVAAGLPGAIAFFLAGADREDRRIPLTVVAIALTGGLAGTALWAAGSPLLKSLFFASVPLELVLLIGATVFTQLLVATAKACSQGSDDMRGANWTILNEELMFLPAYGLLLALGVRGYTAAIAGLLLADVAAFVPAWWRLARRRFFRSAARPSLGLARRIVAYGVRQQIGGVVLLLNLRLDFLLLSLLAGPAVLGIYAVASKFAELVKVPGMALQYVLYPQYARDGLPHATTKVRRLLPRAAIGSAAATVPVALLAAWVIPLLYGDDFAAAIVPAQIILVGLLLEGVTGVVSGFLYGVGRPGLNSWAMGAGLVVTVGLDLILIPVLGAVGAAIASSVAYLVTTAALYASFVWVARGVEHRPAVPATLSRAEARS